MTEESEGYYNEPIEEPDYSEEMTKDEYNAEMDAKAEYEAIQEGNAMADQEAQDEEARTEFELLEEKRKISLKLIENVDWKTLLQMAGFVFDEHFIRGHLIASMKLADEKKIDNFIELFKEQSGDEKE